MTLREYLMQTYPMPEKVKRARAAALMQLYYGSAAREEDQPTWQEALDVLRGYCEELPATVYHDRDCDCFTDIEPNQMELDAGSDWRGYGTREVLGAVLGDAELVRYI